MKKNEIYLKMLALALPHIRNIQTHDEFEKGRDMSCYFEAELVHNLTVTLLSPDFLEHDIWFLNHQAKYYFENCNGDISPNYNQNIKYIRDLFTMVPENLKPNLLWQGP
ncbi:zinc ABC transporter substrate-binding protein [Sodalis endosymbiont of Spalangia cameroni]|uniref:zinc ABC transporter substrate-binding protein n=1 Tax=Sodalis praecaptivus TaxID=1239307 RepID=UPI0031F9C482